MHTRAYVQADRRHTKTTFAHSRGSKRVNTSKSRNRCSHLYSTFSCFRTPHWEIKNSLKDFEYILSYTVDPVTSRESAVGIATGYGLDDRAVGVRVPVGQRIFSSARCPDRLWSPRSLLSNGCRGLFPRRSRGRGLKLTTHLELVPRSRKCGSAHPLPMQLHGVVLNYLSTGTNLPLLLTLSVMPWKWTRLLLGRLLLVS
jgi:hypothetical protein